MHQVVMGEKYIDHINGNGLDNRKCNLRMYTEPKFNAANRSVRDGKKLSKYKGVYKDSRTNKYTAYCSTFYLGTFNTEEEAVIAYNEKAIELYGKFARLNVVETTEEVAL